MALRKLILALAAVATITGSASSAFAQQALNCTVTTVVPYVRWQGLTEQVGDIIITCTGGTPTILGATVPVNNFSVSILSTNITSRLLTTSLPLVNGGYPYSEAVLAVNDPYPTDPNPTPAGTPPLIPGASEPSYSVPLNPCPISDQGLCFNTGNGAGGGSPESSYGAAGNFNLFQGYQYDAHTLRFDGIPVDAPGTNKNVIFRITNVRVDATPYAAGNLQAQPITASLQITGTQPVAINNILPYVVAYPTNGIQPLYLPNSSAVCNPGAIFDVEAQEGFASSFKRQNIAFSGDGIAVPAPAPQNVFGYQYFTESGYYLPEGDNINPEQYGLATQGTRIYIPISNVPANVTLTAPLVAYLYGGSPVNVPAWVAAGPLFGGNAPSGEAHLVKIADETTATADGSGYYVPGTAPADNTVFSATAKLSKVFVYEVLWSDPSAVETLDVPFTVDYLPGVPTYFAPPDYVTAQIGLAPISTSLVVNGHAAETVDPLPIADRSIPRFARSLTPITNVYYLTGCQCDLLFPYVASIDGYETGMAIANTSLDPYGTVPQSGYIQLFYYPDFASQYTGALATVGVPFSQTTSAKLNGGDEFLAVIGSGDANGFGIAGTPGFQGYIIAVSGFQYCHGYAFITDSQAQKFAEGYIALQLDDPFLPRYGSDATTPGISPPAYVPGEFLGH